MNYSQPRAFPCFFNQKTQYEAMNHTATGIPLIHAQTTQTRQNSDFQSSIFSFPTEWIPNSQIMDLDLFRKLVEALPFSLLSCGRCLWCCPHRLQLHLHLDISSCNIYNSLPRRRFQDEKRAPLKTPAQEALSITDIHVFPSSHRQPKRTRCQFGLQRLFGRNILELLVYYLMPNKCKNLKDMKSSLLSICTSSL